jgi:glycosyltransferase involved in cell wall biosynthesis
LLGIETKVKFLGWRDNALVIMAAADVVVHPSLEDALSSAVIEALMLGKPIVATDISGVRDSLNDGKYGAIVPPADPAALERSIRAVLDDRERAETRANAGRDYLLEYMDARRVSDEYTRVYQRVLGR